MIEKFFGFAQKHFKLILNTKQELVARILFNEPRFLELLLTKGSGKSTLFDLLEAFASNDPNYLTRAELEAENRRLEESILKLNEERRQLEDK